MGAHQFASNPDGESRCMDCDAREGGTQARNPCPSVAAFHRAAEADAKRQAASHPELVDDYSDADPGL